MLDVTAICMMHIATPPNCKGADRKWQREGVGYSFNFGLSIFVHPSVEDAIKSREIHIPSALRHHGHKHDDKAVDDRNIELPREH